LITVAIIGAGPLGRWLGLACARAGFRVLLEDVMPANLHHAQEYIRQQLGPAAADIESLPIRFVTSIEEAVREADLAIDCVPDELESKLEILFLLDRMAPPRTVLATPTTHLSIADLASCTYRPDRCLAIAADPRRLAGIPASEVILKTTPSTSEKSISLVSTFWHGLGFTPVFHQESAALPAAPVQPA
jgi:3-hydroxybutyryl-CoA dehydrogenase